MHKAYLRFANFFNEKLIFVTDDDIWYAKVDFDRLGQTICTRRLTTSSGWIDGTAISPDGSTICYSSNDSSEFDVYQMPIEGGVSERLTYLGDTKVVGFWDKKNLVVRSSADQINRFQETLKKVELQTGNVEDLNLGPATDFAKSESNIVLGRFTKELGRWKGYRGGLTGNLWIRLGAKAAFKKLMAGLDSNLSCPNIIGKRIYFLSDHEGSGNIYSCNMQGRDLKRHTNYKELYVRQLVCNSSGEQDYLLFHRGGELFFLDIDTDEVIPLQINVESGWKQSQPRFVQATSCLQDFDLSGSGKKIASVLRGQLHILTPWLGAPYRAHLEGIERVRAASFGKDNDLFITAVNGRGEDIILEYDIEERKVIDTVLEEDVGKICYVSPSPDGQYLAFSTERYHLYLLEIGKKKLSKIDSGTMQAIEEFDWSPDSKWIVYSANFGFERNLLKIFSLKTSKSSNLIEPVVSDTHPCFDPSGKYIYFLGVREFIPRISESHLHIGYPDAVKPYAIRLQRSEQSPFDKPLFFEEDSDDCDDKDEKNDNPDSSELKERQSLKKSKKKKSSEKKVSKKRSKAKSETNRPEKAEQKSDEEKIEPVEIDFDDIDSRIESFPVDIGGYDSLICANDRVFWTRDGSDSGESSDSEDSKSLESTFQCYIFKEGEIETIADGVYSYALSDSRDFLLYEDQKELRLVPTDVKPTEGSGFNRKDGWIDLNQVRVQVDPRFEWMQMYKEAWVLQREHFWHEKLEGWLPTFKRYLPLLAMIHTRSEFSDLIWEMQGELKTSHCYEYAGDFPKKGTFNLVGRLGADFRYLPRKKCLQIETVYRGDPWRMRFHSPLISKQAELQVGDLVYEVDGIPIENLKDIYQLLEHKVDAPVDMKVQRRGSSEKEHILVKPISDERPLRYRNWITQNRKTVHASSKEKLGYIHIPDMGMDGYAEFTRQILNESGKEGLILDLRYNAGGFVSELILPILTGKTLGYFKGRYDKHATPYPALSVPGPKILLLNEFTGSDGDIFCHAFKSSGVGVLVGKRSWGGVIGIMPKVGLIDGTVTTQPEYGTWFEEIEYGLENYGTNPDYEVEITPDDWSQGLDPQLDKAISLGMKQLAKAKLPESFQKSIEKSSKPPRLPK